MRLSSTTAPRCDFSVLRDLLFVDDQNVFLSLVGPDGRFGNQEGRMSRTNRDTDPCEQTGR